MGKCCNRVVIFMTPVKIAKKNPQLSLQTDPKEHEKRKKKKKSTTGSVGEGTAISMVSKKKNCLSCNGRGGGTVQV